MRRLRWARHFQEPERERLFIQEQDAVLWRHDQLAGILTALMAPLFAFRYWSNFPVSFKFRELVLGALFLLPWACSWRGSGDFYLKHRVRIVCGLRLIGTLCLIHVWDQKDFISPLVIPPTQGQAFATLMFLTNLSDQLFFSHGFRLPFYLHCLVQAPSVIATLRALPDSCSLPMAHMPLLVEFYQQAANLLGRCRNFLTPASTLEALQPGSASKGALHVPADVHCSCVVVLATLVVVVGYLLPAFLVALGERRARAAFVERRLSEGGWSLEERRYHLLFDPLMAWLWLSLLLPFIVCAVWQLVMMVAVRASMC